ncbi:UbiA prenyltransferase [Fistulina hepatica ATCC 64428]|uniref:4-hydroxybenzoate polyprenyltransferase, mitochondrial n=1 Tax=Fistulina hepatica ATCC 64428 TaxID=1128425 RepID=A0A0D7ASX5_9AGAR|nr:UbiA prenyltransferase [Fistulina hepatica ATCC 64428]
METAPLLTDTKICKATNIPSKSSEHVLWPYLELIRFEKPTGTILMFWPFAWGLTMAAYHTGLPPADYATKLAECFVGAFLIRSSACTINDIFDRHVDAGVERTKNRPLASGRITVFAASMYLSFQYILGIAFFYYSVGLSFAFAIYPLLKRVTYWPQAWLGFAMNFGVVTAWASVAQSVDGRLLSVTLTGCWCWTMLYVDTIYACQDVADDVKVGVRSTALLFGSWIRPLLMGCAALFVAMFSVAGLLNGHGLPFFVFGIGGMSAHLVWQFLTVRLDDPSSCWVNFKRNGSLGWIIWGALLVDYLRVQRGMGIPIFW